LWGVCMSMGALRRCRASARR